MSLFPGVTAPQECTVIPEDAIMDDQTAMNNDDGTTLTSDVGRRHASTCSDSDTIRSIGVLSPQRRYDCSQEQ